VRDLFNHIHPLRAISPVAGAADNTPFVSEIIDTKGFDSLTFVISTGALPDADATFTVLVEDGDAANLSDAAAVADENLLGTEAQAGFTFADDNETRKIGYVGFKRYVRLTITPASNTGASLVSAVAILGHAHLEPTANPPV
jgi:hypothetical protein